MYYLLQRCMQIYADFVLFLTHPCGVSSCCPHTQICPCLNLSPQWFVSSQSIPAYNSFYRCWYRCQCTFIKYISPIIPEYRSCCIILHCLANVIGKKMLLDSVCHWMRNKSISIVKCVLSISTFLLLTCVSPTTFVSVP